MIGIPSEQDLSPRDSTQLRQSGVEVFPVMHGENGEGDIEGSVGKGEVLGHASDAPAAWVLREHDARGLEGDDGAI